MAQLEKLLSTGLYVAMVLCGVAACDNSDDNELKDTSYTLDKIEWKLDTDKVEVNEIKIPQEVYSNASSNEMQVTTCGVENYTQTSQFYTDNPQLFQLLNQVPIDVYIPSGENAFDGFFYTSSGPLVPFSLEEYTYPAPPNSTNSILLPPKTILTFDATILERKVTATYRACFTGNDSGKQIEITGQWKGVFYETLTNKLITKDI